jgi:hypothetical protein
MKLVRPTQQHSEQIMAYRTAFLTSGDHSYRGSSIQTMAY